MKTNLSVVDYRKQTFAIPLWDEGGFTKGTLIHIREERGNAAFERGFRQRAITDEDKLFPHFLQCKKPIKIEDLGEIDAWKRYSGVDPASEVRPGSVIFTIGKSPQGVRIPIEIRRGAWKGGALVDQIGDAVRTNRSQVCMVENNALQDIIRQWALEKDRSLPLKGYRTGSQKSDEIEGLPGMDVEMENNGWLFPGGEWDGHSGNCQCSWCVWEREMMDYPQSETSDCVMAMWFAREASRMAVVQVF